MSHEASPATGRRTQHQRRAESGRRLLQAATELIAERGWEATTAAEIGRRAGFSRTMVHMKYGNKDALLDTLMRSEYEERITPAPDPHSPGLDRVLAPLERIAALCVEDPEFLEAMFVMSFEAVKRGTVLRPRIQEWMERIACELEDGLRSGVRDGSVRADVVVDDAVRDVIGGAVGIAYGWIVMPERFDLVAEFTRLANRTRTNYETCSSPNTL